MTSFQEERKKAHSIEFKIYTELRNLGELANQNNDIISNKDKFNNLKENILNYFKDVKLK